MESADAIEVRLKVVEDAVDNLKQRLDKLEEAHYSEFEKIRTDFSKDYQKLSDEFRLLQKEYEVSKAETNKDLSVLKDMPELIQALREAVQEIKVVLETTQGDLLSVQDTLAGEMEKGKFDIVIWLRDHVVPTLLTGGIIYFILNTAGII